MTAKHDPSKAGARKSRLDDEELQHSDLDRRQFLQHSMALGASAWVAGGVALTAASRPAGAASLVKYELKVTGNDDEKFYNGKSPGPALIANAGDTIEVRLINDLPKKDDDCVPDPNMRHGENTTNLHTHGLHVRPDKDSSGRYDADNIFLKIVPKDQAKGPCWNDDVFRRHETTYRFELPKDHPPGTHWYHAHKHGSTASQVIDGLAGPIIIKDPPGRMPPYIEKAKEQIIMITGVSPKAVLVDPAGGGHTPEITMRPGEVQRWRIINSVPLSNAFIHLKVDSPEIEVWQIAYDGLTLPRRVKVDTDNDDEPWLNPAALAPGNRTDLMVRVRKGAPSAKVRLLAEQAVGDFIHAPSAAEPAILAAQDAQVTVQIEGDPVDHEWSDDDNLPGPGLEPIDEGPLNQRATVFERVDDKFVIDGVSYDGKPKKKMKLGTSEEWVVLNTTTGTHPFHIHVNPFFVTHINGELLGKGHPLRRWQDTIALPGADRETNQAGSVTFRTRFADFTGKFVIHCHILFHEDAGMMQAVEVA